MKTIKMDDIDYTKASEASALAHEFMGKINSASFSPAQTLAVGGSIAAMAIQQVYGKNEAIEFAAMIRDFEPKKKGAHKMEDRGKVDRAVDGLRGVLLREKLNDKEIMEFFCSSLAGFLQIKFDTPVDVDDVTEHMSEFTGKLLLKGIRADKMSQA